MYFGNAVQDALGGLWRREGRRRGGWLMRGAVAEAEEEGGEGGRAGTYGGWERVGGRHSWSGGGGAG